MKSKKLLSTILALVMVASLSTTAFALTEAPGVYESGGNESVPVTLNVAPAIFSVTVPSVLPVSVTADGEVVCAESGEARIINYSHGAVKVTNLEIDAINGWETVDFDNANMHKVAVNSRLFAFTINDEKTTGADAITFDAANFPVLDGYNDTDSDELVIDYDALIAPQNAAVVDMDIANIVFTIAWEEKPAELIEFYIYHNNELYTYQVLDNMTWGQWTESEYNSSDDAGCSQAEKIEKFVSPYDGLEYIGCDETRGYVSIYEDSEDVLASDRIIAGATYEVRHK